MATLREIITRIRFAIVGGDLGVVKAEVAKTKRELRAGARAAREFRSSLQQVISVGKAFIAFEVGKRVLGELTTKFSEPQDKMAKFSKATGLALEDLQAWTYGAGLSGASADELTIGLRTMATGMMEASKGTKTYTEIFDGMGVKLRDGKGQMKTQRQLLMEIADAYAGAEDGSIKAALAQKLFGRSGSKLVPFLNEGSRGIEKMTAEARRLGAVNAGYGQVAEPFNDSLLRVKMTIDGLRARIAMVLLPTLTALADRFAAWTSTGDNAAQLLHRIGIGAKVAGGYLGFMAASKIASVFSAIVTGAQAAAMALKLMFLNPAGIIITGIVALGAALYDVYRITHGQKSILLRFLGDGKVATSIKEVLFGLYRTLSDLWTAIKPSLVAIGKAFMEAFSSLWNALQPIIPYLVKILGWAIKYLSKPIIWFFKLLAMFFAFAAKKIAWAAKFIEAMVFLIGKAWDWVSEKAARAADWVKDAWETVAAPFRTALAWVETKWDAFVAKVKSTYAWIKGLIGGGDVTFNPTAVDLGAQQRAANLAFNLRRAQETGWIDNSIQVQGLSVSVTAAPNMSPGEFQDTIKVGVRQALGDIVKQSYQNRAQVVP